MKEIMKAEDERRIRWGKKWWKEKMKWEWDDERNVERKRWNENGEDEMRMSWWKEWWKQKMKGE